MKGVLPNARNKITKNTAISSEKFWDETKLQNAYI